MKNPSTLCNISRTVFFRIRGTKCDRGGGGGFPESVAEVEGKTVPSYPTMQPPGNTLRASKVLAFPSVRYDDKHSYISGMCPIESVKGSTDVHVARFTPPMFQSFPWKVSSNMGPAFFPSKRSRKRISRSKLSLWNFLFCSPFLCLRTVVHFRKFRLCIIARNTHPISLDRKNIHNIT